MCFSIIPYEALYKCNIRFQFLYKQMNLLLVNGGNHLWKGSKRLYANVNAANCRLATK